MDDSTYNPSQANMITLNATNATTNDQPTTFGPLLFDVLNDVSNKIGGAQYLLGEYNALPPITRTKINGN